MKKKEHIELSLEENNLKIALSAMHSQVHIAQQILYYYALKDNFAEAQLISQWNALLVSNYYFNILYKLYITIYLGTFLETEGAKESPDCIPCPAGYF